MQGILLQQGPTRFSEIVVDSRKVTPGSLFIALPGQHVDGHRFVLQALKRGAAGVVIQRRKLRIPKGKTVILVKDTQKGLLTLGKYFRYQRPIPFIGVTGSSGKTTTKEMVATVLSERFRVFKNRGNLNTDIGLPIAFSHLRKTDEIGVVEMAMQRRKEIQVLAELIRPRVGIITNIGPAHIEFTGSLKNTARGKAELLEALPKDGVAVLPADDPFFSLLKKHCRAQRIISYGFSKSGDIHITQFSQSIRGARIGVHIRNGSLFPHNSTRHFVINISSPGEHMAKNALVAIAMGLLMKVPLGKITSALEKFRPPEGRFNIQKQRGVVLLRDEYNANPDSMRYALESLSAIGKEDERPTVAVLGDMLELGKKSARYHREIGRTVKRLGITHLITFGKWSHHISESSKESSNSVHAQTHAQAAHSLKKLLLLKPIILFKGSRGMHLEKVAQLAGLG